MNEQFINELATALRKVGTIHTVGEEWVSYIGEIPNGGVPYCGQEVTRTTYSALWTYAQEKGLVKTEAEWKQIATANGGNVPYYSNGNGSSTFRMPKLVGYVRGASSQSEAGSYVKEGLPNIEGSTSFTNASASAVGVKETSGAFTEGSASKVVVTQDSTASLNLKPLVLDASRSSAIYGNSSHVTPETSVVMFGVYAFGVVTNAGELDVSAIARDVSDAKMGLNGVVRSINGLTADASGEVSVVIPPTYVLPTATSSVIGGVKVGSNITNTDGKISLSKSNVTSALGYTPVKSVNGTSADANGNVTLAISSGTVSQKLKTTFSTSKDYAVNTTKSITGLTANKPVYLVICNGNASGVYCWISSGIDYSNMYDYSNASSEGYLQGSNSKYWVVIPTGTSISIVVRHHRDTPINLVAYQ